MHLCCLTESCGGFVVCGRIPPSVSAPQKQEGLNPTFVSGDGPITSVTVTARYMTNSVCSGSHHDGESAAEPEAATHAGSAVSRGGWAPTFSLPMFLC